MQSKGTWAGHCGMRSGDFGYVVERLFPQEACLTWYTVLREDPPHHGPCLPLALLLLVGSINFLAIGYWP